MGRGKGVLRGRLGRRSGKLRVEHVYEIIGFLFFFVPSLFTDVKTNKLSRKGKEDFKRPVESN